MPGVEIRPVQLDDLETLYEHQADPIAAEMAAFPSRDRDVFFNTRPSAPAPGRAVAAFEYAWKLQ